jgi:hypothetical protein
VKSTLAIFFEDARKAADEMHATLPALDVDDDALEAELAEAQRRSIEFFERQDREAAEARKREDAEFAVAI